MSDTLADFAPEDVAGRKKVVDQILALREAWKDARYEAETGQPRRKTPANALPKPTEIRLGMPEAEIQLEVNRIRVNISKNKKKLAEQPDHKNAPHWQAELERLLVMQEQYDTELRRLKYETTQ